VIEAAKIANAHRLGTIREAGTIIVIDCVEIVEKGDHESLLKQKMFTTTFTSASLASWKSSLLFLSDAP